MTPGKKRMNITYIRTGNKSLMARDAGLLSSETTQRKLFHTKECLLYSLTKQVVDVA